VNSLAKRRMLTVLAAAVAVSVVGYVLPDDTVARGVGLVCKPQKSHQPEVGKLERIDFDNVYLGKNLLESDNAPLFTNSTLCTDDEGQVKFFVEPLKRTTCILEHNTRVRLYPPRKPAHRQVIIRFEEGEGSCGTGKDQDPGDKKFDADGGRWRLLMKDPLFAVGVDTRRTIVKVALGYIEVSRQAGEGAVIVGPEQQVILPAGGKPGPVQPIELTAKDNARFAELRPEVPKPDFRRPDPDGSATLKRIISRKVLSVGVAADLVNDNGTQPFVRSFFGFLAKSWGVKLRLISLETPDWVNQLEAQAIDVAISRDARRLRQFDTLPVFPDSQSALWYIGLVKDKHFLNSMRAFLRAAVNSGDYGTIYRASFLKEPSYEPLSPVLFG